MNTKLFAALVLSTALALSACSGGGTSPASSTTPVADDPAADPVDDTRTQAEKFEDDQTTAKNLLDAARRMVEAAVELATGAASDEARTTARTEIARARTALDDAVKAARALTAPPGDETRRLRALGIASRAENDLAELTRDLDRALDSQAWYRQSLVDYQVSRSLVTVTSLNTVIINRIPRTRIRPGTESTVEANPAAFTSTTFKDILYADGKEIFSTSDDGDGGDEFKVDGYVGWRDSDWYLEENTYTGLKLTSTGLVIRTGGTTTSSTDLEDSEFLSDFTDMRRKITDWANDPDSDGDPEKPFGQNGWDLVLTFNEPQPTLSAPVASDISENFRSNRIGGGDFYWRSFVPADPEQYERNGDYYVANAFNQPDDGRYSLGTYEVWLSNHIGVDTNAEPSVPGTTVICPDESTGTSCPSDDEPYYLKYAAYGLHVFTADTATPLGGNSTDGYYNGRSSRINTLHFGYSAFRNADGQRTTDIGEQITSGEFHGRTLAYETMGGRENAIFSKLLRGDVTLTVTIPKGTGAGTLAGTMSNFQSWQENGNYWTNSTYDDNFMIALNSATINNNGTFAGSTRATPVGGDFNNAGGGFLTPPRYADGHYKGSFYGPRTDRSDLEIAGSWTVGGIFAASGTGLNSERKTLYGSFGAKQRPAGN